LHEEPAPDLIMETLNAYKRTEALRAAIELELFTLIDRGHRTSAALAEESGAAERGVRILGDYLVILGLLAKQGTTYSLTPETKRYLVRGSEDYLGSADNFLGSPALRRGFGFLAAAVRRGGTALEKGGTMSPEHAVWVEYARGMAPVMAPTAEALAELIGKQPHARLRILDLAAGHGLFGINIAAGNPGAEVNAVDWPHVLEVAQENATAAGLDERYRTIPGNAFDVEFDSGYDLVLLTNFLHHFDREACVAMLRKVHQALDEAGRAVLLEYVPNEDRVSPEKAASFALTMLATTPAGDAYTYSEYQGMLREAGFGGSSFHQLSGSAHQVVIGTKPAG
jgi:ubiquinone/menaquinone biosynthesis C-methylase UbiE